MAEKTAEEIGHLWQSFRERCVELAIKSGAMPGDAIEAARQIANYIMTPDDLQKKSSPEKGK